MLNSGFGALASSDIDLIPGQLSVEIDQQRPRYIQNSINGVYRAGFATTQVSYEEAYHEVL